MQNLVFFDTKTTDIASPHLVPMALNGVVPPYKIVYFILSLMMLSLILTGCFSGGSSDDSTGDFIISNISRNTTEAGGMATFTMRLANQPDDDVVIDVTTSDSSEGTVSPLLLTFTTNNYNVIQTVTVTGVDDDELDGDQIYSVELTINLSLTKDTTGYLSLDPNDLFVTNEDDDLTTTTTTTSTTTTTTSTTTTTTSS